MNRALALSKIQGLFKRIPSLGSLDVLLQDLLDAACEITGAVHGSIAVVENDSTLSIQATHGPDWTPEAKACRLSLGEGITGWSAMTGMLVYAPNIKSDSHYFPLFSYVESELASPIIVDSKVWGVINIDGLSVNAFDPPTVEVFSMFSQMASLAILHQQQIAELKELHEFALYADKVAGIRRMAAAERSGVPVASF